MLVVIIICKVILGLLLILLAILLAIIFIPFGYFVHGEKYDEAWCLGSVSWLFGGLKVNFKYSTESKFTASFRIIGFNKRINENNSTKADKEKTTKTEQKKKSTKSPFSYYKLEVLKKLIYCILKVLNHCKPGQLEVNASVGFSDPMYTGLLYAIRSSCSAILDKYNIRLIPTFEDEEIRGYLKVKGRIQIFYLLLVAIEFVFTQPIRGIFIKNLKFKFKRRVKSWQTLTSRKI